MLYSKRIQRCSKARNSDLDDLFKEEEERTDLFIDQQTGTAQKYT